jgi:hypothetical protein
MSRIPTPTLDTATSATAEIYARIKKAAGKAPNTFAAIPRSDPGRRQSGGEAGRLNSPALTANQLTLPAGFRS